MKIIPNILFASVVFGALLSSVSCRKDFEELNQPYNQAGEATATIPGLYNGLVSSLAKYGDDILNVGVLYPTANQQAFQNISTPFINYAGGFWSQYYPDLVTYRSLLKKIAEQTDPASFNNVKYMATILLASKTLRMLDYYGDIPYSQAGKANEGATSFRPAYDAAPDVYKSVLEDLKEAADGLSNDASQVSIGASESYLGGDITAWKKFGNALRLRYAVRLYNKENAVASAIITDIINGNKPLPNNQQAGSMQKNNFGFWPNLVTTTSTTKESLDSKWNSYRELSISNMRMSSNVWNQMSSTNATNGSGIFDPRCFVFFQTNDANLWVPQPQDGSQTEGGTPYGTPGAAEITARKPFGTDAGNKFASFNFWIAYDRLFYPILVITEADVHFLLAEIYQRGMGVPKDVTKAKTEYEAGIRSSVDFWYDYTKTSAVWTTKPTAPTPAQMTAMLINPKVIYNGANDADALRKIATQAWLATMFQPWEAWAIVRRTQLTPRDPNLPPLSVNRMPYPDDENVNNHENWQKASGGKSATDQVSVKVYWMQ
ncbi:SusD/RagB family nutrient-binding outer membrane lipoprotein [Chitinophaga sp. GCM10012297]|uniref:SusD/RagB family nutrient-binding outer membrane lipoprotein n=1 Tax=Chitinophaga chungangae TaxID=2821488 RepID=A0ABS3YC26_9BACT|nr:SusD/RagB family nutrient-binding outer membrane lipoprotein [Chitinophaga chungangae]MBO9152241.1 SusD/RagB family nutrient-binding outer membrane lipoprotein [Chitinophaga chungangae]